MKEIIRDIVKEIKSITNLLITLIEILEHRNILISEDVKKLKEVYK